MTHALEDLFGIDHPIVLGPFGGLSSVALTAAVSAGGGLGSFGLYGYDASRIAEVAHQVRAATDRPFALNLWLPMAGAASETEPTPDDIDLSPYIEALAPLFAAAGVEPPAAPTRFVPSVDEQVAAVWDAAPAVLSVVYGVPSAEVVDGCRARGIRIVGTATTVVEAVALADGGVDAVVASGFEAAGHRVSFLDTAERSLVGTFALVPQIVDAVDVPVIAAGGIADRRGVAAARALGAAGVQVGTAFLRTRQSAASPGHRAALASARDTDTVLTRAMSGRLARGIPNRAIREIEAWGRIAPFPAQNWLTGVFRAAAGGDPELSSLWAGQAAALARHDDAREVLAELVAGLTEPR